MDESYNKLKILKADLMLLLVVIIWGTTFPIMKITLVDIKPFYFIALRFIVAFLLLSVIFNNKIRDINWHTYKKGIILGLWLFAGYAFQIVGLQYTTASRSGFITGLSVVIVPILAVLFLKEKHSFRVWIGVALAITGLFLLTGISNGGVNYGDYLTLFCAVSVAMQIVLLSKYLAGEDPVVLTWVQIGVVSLCGIIFAVFNNEITYISLQTGQVVVYTGLFASALAFLIQSYAQQYTSPTHTGLIFALEPVFGAFFSFIILREILGWNGVIGGCLIISGMVMNELESNKK